MTILGAVAGGILIGIGGALLVGWYLLSKDMEKWW